jgi:hypothetical protein
LRDKWRGTRRGAPKDRHCSSKSLFEHGIFQNPGSTLGPML